MRRRTIAAIALALGVITAQQAATGPGAAVAEASAPSTGSAVLDWNQQTAAATRLIMPAIDPLNESRLYAMVHVAIHDALNTIDRRFAPYALHRLVVPGANKDAAVATAAHDVIIEVLDQLKANYDPASVTTAAAGAEAAYTEALGGISDGNAKMLGITLGRAAAAAILDDRADDHSGEVLLVDVDYPQGTKPGQFRFVEGAPLAFAPEWYKVTPFVLRAASQFKPRPPLDVRSKKYAADVNEVQRLGGNGTSTPSARTTDETQIAYFWFESSPAMWNRIAVTVARQKGLDPWRQARMFALMDMGMADGYIGNWYSKYALYNRWRPETAIRLGGAYDRNPLTVGDPSWQPLIPTGATPSYDSGHSIEGAVAATVMASVIGTDEIAFSACSLTLLTGTCDAASPTLRRFSSLSKASNENGESRILVGWHVRDEVEQGSKHGVKIADRALAHFLRPVHG